PNNLARRASPSDHSHLVVRRTGSLWRYCEVNPESFRDSFQQRGLILSYPIPQHHNTHYGLWRDGLWRYELAGDCLCGTDLLASGRGMVLGAILVRRGAPPLSNTALN